MQVTQQKIARLFTTKRYQLFLPIKYEHFTIQTIDERDDIFRVAAWPNEIDVRAGGF